MNRQLHWNSIYETKPPTDVSWFESEPQVSLALIKEVSPPHGRVIDIGGGASRLVDCLLSEGFELVTVLDISENALERAKTRLGAQAALANWIVGDITQFVDLGQYDVWHDRAVFHFLTDPNDRLKYVELATRTVRDGGHLIIGTFAIEGPRQCSGLEVCQYNSTTLGQELGSRFKLVRELLHTHVTPAGKHQEFVFGLFQLLPPRPHQDDQS